ncbi:MAG TPA: 16S rRNA (guanine(527)-N(7))-methyltransferase RsmG [Rectinemataceae bacterium]
MDARISGRYNPRMEETGDLLGRGLEALGLGGANPGGSAPGSEGSDGSGPGDGSDLESALRRYLAEIESWNPTHGLVSASGDELVVKHILDSLAPWREILALLKAMDEERSRRGIRGGSGLADLGTGAGLPGIPLSLVFKERPCALVERMGKRIAFLESMKAILGLDNARVVMAEAENAPGPLELVTFRAFRPFSELKLFKAVWRRMEDWGCFVAYKGRLEAVRGELDALATNPEFSKVARTAEILPVEVPFLDEERCLVIMRKAASLRDQQKG